MNSGLVHTRTEFNMPSPPQDVMEKDFRGLNVTTKQCCMLLNATSKKRLTRDTSLFHLHNKGRENNFLKCTKLKY